MKAPLGVILAGGQARRMGGGDKALRMLGGQSVLARVIDRLAPQVPDLALNANGDPARFAAFGLPVLSDPVPGFAGPLAGILAGLDWAAAQGADDIVTAAADTPFFPPDLVPRLLLARQDAGLPIALAATTPAAKAQDTGLADRLQRHPTFGLWPVALRDDLRAALTSGQRKVDDWSRARGTALALFPLGSYDPFFNINTPDDLARAERML